MTFLCGRSQKGNITGPCPNTSSVPIPPIANNKQGVPLSWHCDQKTMPGHVIYCGRLDNMKGCGPGYFAAFVDPKYNDGRVIRSNSINLLGNNGKIASDPTRVRTDGLGTPDFGMPVAIPE